MPEPVTPLAAIKRAAVEAVEAGKPVAFFFGTVTSAAPLAVYIDQKTTYPASMLLLTRTVSDYGLAVGDRVLLARVQGGGRYIILDKVGGEDT